MTSSIDRAAALSGIGTVVLFAIGNALWAFDQPDPGASGAELVAFYADTPDLIVVGGSMSFASIALLVFFASGLRRRLAAAEGDDVLANTGFAGALLLGAAGLGAEGINMVAALRAREGELSEPLAQALFETSYVFGTRAAGIGAGVLLLATAAVALRRRALLPRWLALLVVPFGVAMLTPLSEFHKVVVWPAYIVVLAALGVGMLRSRTGPAGTS